MVTPGKEITHDETNKNQEDFFELEEIDIEELSIDGICGVY